MPVVAVEVDGERMFVAFKPGADNNWSLWKYAQRHPEDMGYRDVARPVEVRTDLPSTARRPKHNGLL